MVDLQPSDIKKFKALYKEKFDIELDDATARHKLSLLVRQMEIVYQPITKEQLDEYEHKEAMKRDAQALAGLIYDIYQDDKNRKKTEKTEQPTDKAVEKNAKKSEKM